MYSLKLEKKALKTFEKLDPEERKRIAKKIDAFFEYENPLAFAKRLKNYKLGEYRFRVGDYRLIADVNIENKIIKIMRIGHRREIYK